MNLRSTNTISLNATGNGITEIGGNGTGAITIGATGLATISVGGTGTTTLTLRSTGATNINTTGNGGTNIGGTGTGTINIGGTAVAPVNILTASPTTNTKQITVGATSGAFDTNTTLSGKTTITKLAAPLTPVYDTIAITSDKIGYTVLESLTLDSIAPYGDRNMFTAVTLPRGVWSISFSIRMVSDNPSGTTINEYAIWVRDSITYNATPFSQISNNVPQIIKTLSLNGTGILTSDGTTAYTIPIYLVYNLSSPDIIRLQTTNDYKSAVRRTRIA